MLCTASAPINWVAIGSSKMPLGLSPHVVDVFTGHFAGQRFSMMVKAMAAPLRRSLTNGWDALPPQSRVASSTKLPGLEVPWATLRLHWRGSDATQTAISRILSPSPRSQKRWGGLSMFKSSSSYSVNDQSDSTLWQWNLMKLLAFLAWLCILCILCHTCTPCTFHLMFSYLIGHRDAPSLVVRPSLPWSRGAGGYMCSAGVSNQISSLWFNSTLERRPSARPSNVKANVEDFPFRPPQKTHLTCQSCTGPACYQKKLHQDQQGIAGILQWTVRTCIIGIKGHSLSLLASQRVQSKLI